MRGGCDALLSQHVTRLFLSFSSGFVQLLADLENNRMFSDDLECQKLLMEAMKYHLLPERRPMFQSPRTKPRKSTVGALYAVGGMDATKGAALGQRRSKTQRRRLNCTQTNVSVCVCVSPCGYQRLHHRGEVRPADQHLGPGGGDERTAAAVRRGGHRQQAVRGRREGRTQDLQHGGVLQPHQQSLVHHAPDVNTQARTWWVTCPRSGLRPVGNNITATTGEAWFHTWLLLPSHSFQSRFNFENDDVENLALDFTSRALFKVILARLEREHFLYKVLTRSQNHVDFLWKTWKKLLLKSVSD